MAKCKCGTDLTLVESWWICPNTNCNDRYPLVGKLGSIFGFVKGLSLFKSNSSSEVPEKSDLPKNVEVESPVKEKEEEEVKQPTVTAKKTETSTSKIEKEEPKEQRITPKIAITGLGTFVYDGSPHPATAEIQGAARETLDSPTITYTKNGETVGIPRYAGTYTVTAVSKENKQFDASKAEGEIVISKVKLIVKANDKEMIAGDKLPSLDGSFEGAVSGDLLVATFKTVDKPSEQKLGEYPIVLDTLEPSGLLGNYEMETRPGVLKILSREEASFKEFTRPHKKIVEWCEKTVCEDPRLEAFLKLWKEVGAMKTWQARHQKVGELDICVKELYTCQTEVREIEEVTSKIRIAIKAYKVEWEKMAAVLDALDAVAEKIKSVCPELEKFEVLNSDESDDLLTLEYLHKQFDNLPKAKEACDKILIKWQLASNDALPVVQKMQTMRLMKVHSKISKSIVGNEQVADLALTGPGFTGFRYHALTEDLKGWDSIRLGGETSGCAPVAICRFVGNVLEVAMTAEHNNINEYVKRTPAKVETTFEDYLAYRDPTEGPCSC